MVFALRLVLVAVFLVAAVGKARDLPATRTSLVAFGLPADRARAGALALVLGEVLTAVALLVVPVLGATASLVLLAVFSGAVLRALRAGDAPACHCFGGLSAAPVGAGVLARNAGLALVALSVLLDLPWLGLAGVVLAIAAALRDARPHRLGRRVPRFTALAPGGGVVAGRDVGGLLVCVDEGCGPCQTLLADLPAWPFDDLAVIPVLADAALRARLGVAGTPGGLLVQAGRIVSAPALGAPAIEALARGGAEPSDQVWEAFGVAFALAAARPDDLQRLRALLPPGAVPRPDAQPTARWALVGEAGPRSLYRDGGLVHRTDDLDLLLELVGPQIRLHVAEHAPAHVFVHAGVVAWRGEVVLVPGRSYTGKSTLTAALLRAGATYLSDEYAVLDADGLVHPYVKPLALRRPGTFVQEDHALAGFTDLPTPDGPLPLGAVVLAPYEEGARWEPRPITAGAACLALIANTVGVRADPPRTMATIRRAAGDVLALEAPRGEADETARALLAYLDGRVAAAAR